MLLTQPDRGKANDPTHTTSIKRLAKGTLGESLDYEVQIDQYIGPKKADMPEQAARYDCIATKG